MVNDLEKSNKIHTTGSILNSATQKLLEGLTGIASSKREDLTLSIGFMLQKLRAGEFLSQLSREWEKLKEKGRIKDDDLKSDQQKDCLQGILDFLEEDKPDKERFELLKKLFFLSSMQKSFPEESFLPSQFMKLGRILSTVEIKIVFACFRLSSTDNANRPIYREINDPLSWAKAVAKEATLQYSELVLSFEEELIKKGLLSDRVHHDRSGVVVTPYFRLTQMGFDFCQFVSSYDSCRMNES
ncbi:MAG: hypothetical protein HQM09_22540 [Candidatus Riflebacteria bacterium]|nr:hypothetical protein [Candidatus Riflebacteria bacterium]